MLLGLRVMLAIEMLSITKNNNLKIYLLQTIDPSAWVPSQLMIYFGDPELVEKHLHEDLNTIIKNVKIR